MKPSPDESVGGSAKISANNDCAQVYTTRLALGTINRDRDLQARAGTTDEDHVCDLTATLEGGGVLPPVDVFHDGAEYWLADGWHRLDAHERAGRVTIAANVHQGGRRDALLYAVGANARHGLRRTNADKRRSVSLMLSDSEWALWSDRAIADRCGVHHSMVGAVRRDQLADSASSPRLGADGRVRRLPERETGLVGFYVSAPDRWLAMYQAQAGRWWFAWQVGDELQTHPHPESGDFGTRIIANLGGASAAGCYFVAPLATAHPWATGEPSTLLDELHDGARRAVWSAVREAAA